MTDYSIPTANYTAPDGLSTLSNLMSLKQKSQALQSGALAIQGQTADVQMKQQDASQRQGLANIDWDKHLDSNGLLDTASFAKDPDIRKKAGDQYPDLLAKANQVRQGQIANQQQLLKLNQDQVGALASTVGGLKTDPDVQADNAAGRQKVTNALSQFGQTYGPQAAQVAQIYAPMVQHAPPGKLPGAIQALQLQSQSAEQQIATTSPQGAAVQGRSGINYVNTNPNAGQPVGSQMGQPVTDQGTAPAIMAAPNGQIVRVPAGGGGLPSIGGGSGVGSSPAAPPPGRPRTAQDDAPGLNSSDLQRKQYEASAAQAQKDVLDARETDKGYGNSIAISKAIRHLAPEADTGPGREALNKILAGVGANVGTSNQELGAFLDRQAATLRTQMGLPGTNAGAEDSKQIAGHTGYTAQAIMDKNDYTQALVEGAHQYRNGLDRVEGFSGQASPKAVNAFKNAWTNNFDPNVYKLDIAKEQGPEAFKKFVNSLDPKEAASLSQKRKNLQMLSNGQIPQ